jgi:predicted nucleic acid-binding protein
LRGSLRRCSVSSSGRVRLLLDSTYLLPVVGVDVEGVEGALRILERGYRLGKFELYYTPFNLLEIIGKLSKLDKVDAGRVRLGLRALEESFRLVVPGVEAYMLALELRRRGFRDLIDLLLYATARVEGLRFLTRDEPLLRFLQTAGVDVSVVVGEEELEKLLE